MSKQSRKRETAIDDQFDIVLKNSESTVSKLVQHTAEAKLFITFLHDNLINNKGELSEGDRIKFKNRMVPLYPQISQCLEDIAALFSIYDEDNDTWIANFDTYKADNPGTLEEALAYFPQVD